MDTKKVFFTACGLLEFWRQYKKGDTPVPEIAKEFLAYFSAPEKAQQSTEYFALYWSALESHPIHTIDNDIQAIQKKLAGKKATEQAAILDAECANKPEVQRFLQQITADIDFHRRIQAKIARLLTPHQSAVMPVLLQALAKQLYCKAEAKAVALALTQISSEDEEGIQNRLQLFALTVKACVNDQEDKGELASQQWCDKVWEAFCALLLLAVDLSAVRHQLANDTNGTVGIEVHDQHAFTLAVVNGRHHHCFPVLTIDVDQIIHEDEIPLTKTEDVGQITVHSPPHLTGIQAAALPAMRHLLSQIYHHIDSTPGNHHTELVSDDIGEVIKEIQDMLDYRKAEEQAYYLTIEQDQFTDPVWMEALYAIDQQFQSSMLIFKVIRGSGKGTQSGLLLFRDGVCQQHINTMREQIRRLAPPSAT